MKKPLATNIISLYRYFALLSGFYFFGIYLYQILYAEAHFLLRIQSLINIGISLALVIYFSFPVLVKRLGKRYLSYGISAHLIITAFALGLTFFIPNLDIDIVLNSIWSLMPVWLVLLVIIAWQYPFTSVLVYTFFVNTLEIALIFFVVRSASLLNIQYLGLPVINGFAFVIAGRTISELVTQEQQRQTELLKVNETLSAYTQTLEDLSVSRERNRIARELHDTLSHTLSGTAINLEAVKRLIPQNPQKASDMIDSSLFAVRKGLTDTRRALQDLRAAPLEELGLTEALRQLLQGIRERENIRVSINIPEKVPLLTPKVEHVFYRIAQEGLENILRHASAGIVNFDLVISPKGLQMILQDDGLGFDTAGQLSNDHLGLIGMQERAQSIGAHLTVSSVPGRGTILMLIWEQ
ncbi:MAG: sensor histidine kinase [Anaerolineaceae bacterium]|nr:sensor histidine kinase [Anaerolineaceae bacterium]